ncbi:MAG: hypothetical protein M3273_06485 [Actinomycetota bacterium]|nr:hypothetical protein [Actinomycetota bacterium]
MLTERIEALRGPDRGGGITYLVLRTCFVDGAKSFQAAARLGLSERQVSRERSRGISLLLSELAPPASATARTPPLPPVEHVVPRPALLQKLARAVERARHVRVVGGPGVGKTSLVAYFAAYARARESVFWYTVRPHVNADLTALLFDLGEHLAATGATELGEYVGRSLPSPDPALGTRLALKALDGASRLLVFDDFHAAESSHGLRAFVLEATARLPDLRVVTIERSLHGSAGEAVVEVGRFTRDETGAFLGHAGARCDDGFAGSIHSVTGGDPRLLAPVRWWLAASSEEEAARAVAALRHGAATRGLSIASVLALRPRDRRGAA